MSLECPPWAGTGISNLHVGGAAVPAYFGADPIPKGGTLSEARVVQPTSWPTPER